MIELIHRVVFILLILKLFLTLYQRRFIEVGVKKRLLSLYQSLFLGVVYGLISGIITLNHPDYLIYIVLVVTIIFGYLLRKKLFSYRRKCERCGENLSISQILFIDNQKCEKCENLD